jgi:hypothetical protein
MEARRASHLRTLTTWAHGFHIPEALISMAMLTPRRTMPAPARPKPPMKTTVEPEKLSPVWQYTWMDKFTRSAVDPSNPRSVSAQARRRRWTKFLGVFTELRSMRVLDLGGTTAYWESAPVKPKSVTVVNLSDEPSTNLVTAFQGDACAPPMLISQGRFDLVVSNSLLEHVGGHLSRTRLADVVHTSADFHWIQTPYRYFPMEPHWMFPGIQFLPFAARVRVTERWPLGHMKAANRASAISHVHEVELLGITQMRSYFPTSSIWCERFAGLIKSLVAYKSS